jgi:serine/threonine protein kinase
VPTPNIPPLFNAVVLPWTNARAKNLLVVERPPEKEWWVKISDFGISKRSTDGRLAFSTVNIGTQEYIAPEVRLITPKHKGEKASYTVAADMWSLGAICVRLITANPAFDLKGLVEYFYGGERFDPEHALASDGATQEGRDFVSAIMDRDPKHRPQAHEAIKHAWMAPSWRLSPGVSNSEHV